MNYAHNTDPGFEDLDCWKASRDLRIFIAKTVVPTLPQSERFRLADQLIRAARSITANIAEGHGRFHYADNSKFCRYARGSCDEVVDHVITACDEDLVGPALLAEVRLKASRARQLINGYIRYLGRMKGDAEHGTRDT